MAYWIDWDSDLMMLGSDVSDLSTDSQTAAAKGLSLVVPCYNEAPGLTALHDKLVNLARTLKARYGLACEVVYVDDGSRDDTLKIAQTLPADEIDVQVISLSRNFGKEAALMAGLDHCKKGAVLFMDGDGQHPPEFVEKLVHHWIVDGYDVVFTAKAHRDNESFPLRLAVRGFYSLINWGARTKIPEDAGDFRLLAPRVAALRQLPERNRFFKGLATWIGFRQLRVDYEPQARAHGVSSFNPKALIGLSIEGLTSFSVAPLRLASLFGLLFAGAAFLFGISILWETNSVDGKSVPGYPSLMVGIMTIGGVQLIMIGVLGEYIGKILSELKGRPVYFIAEHSVKHAAPEAAVTPSPDRTAAE